MERFTGGGWSRRNRARTQPCDLHPKQRHHRLRGRRRRGRRRMKQQLRRLLRRRRRRRRMSRFHVRKRRFLSSVQLVSVSQLRRMKRHRRRNVRQRMIEQRLERSRKGRKLRLARFSGIRRRKRGRTMQSYGLSHRLSRGKIRRLTLVRRMARERNGTWPDELIIQNANRFTNANRFPNTKNARDRAFFNGNENERRTISFPPARFVRSSS